MDANLKKAIEDENIKYVKDYIDKNGDINIKDEHGYNLLNFSVRRNCLKIVEFLLSKGADVEFKTYYYSWTPLHIAVFGNNSKMIELLLFNGANIETRDNDCHWTPLHRAVYNNHLEATKVLLTHGANRDAMDKNGEKPIKLAKNEKMITLLEEWQDLLELKEPDV